MQQMCSPANSFESTNAEHEVSNFHKYKKISHIKENKREFDVY